jgi:ABC-type transport system substrate-binding protein
MNTTGGGGTNTIDPHYASSYFELFLMYNSLLDVDKNATPIASENALAESFENPDPTTFVFKLRPNVKFHDGSTLTAENVKFSLDRQVAPTPAGQTWKSTLGSYERTEIVEPLTARVKLKNPDGAFTSLMGDVAGMIASLGIAGKAPADTAWYDAGSGRYRNVDHKIDGFRSYAAFEEHWRKGPDGGRLALLDKFTNTNIPDVQTQIASLQTGEVQLLASGANNIVTDETLDKDSSIYLTRTEGYASHGIAVNAAMPPTDNVDFRRAMAWAIDRDTYNKKTLRGIMSPATSILMTGTWAHKPAANLPGFDLTRARTFLERSGIPADQRKLTATVSGDSTDIFAFFQAAWQPLGITLEFIASQQARGRVYKNRGDKGDIHLVIGTAVTDKMDPHIKMAQEVQRDGVFNLGGAEHKLLEELIVKAVSSYDRNVRKQVYGQIQDIQADECFPFIPMLIQPMRQWAKKNVVGVGVRPDGRPFFPALSFSD